MITQEHKQALIGRIGGATPVPPTSSGTPTTEGELYEALLEIGNLVGSVMQLTDILTEICRITATALHTDTCSMYLRGDAVDRDEPGCRQLVLRATYGLRQSMVHVGTFNYGEGIPGWAADKNQIVTVSDARKDPRYAQLDDGPDEHFVAYLCVPLRVQEEVIGVLSIRRRDPHDWTEDDVTIGEIIAKQVAIVVEKARLYHDKIEAERLAAVAISLSETAHSIKNMLQGMSGGAFIVEQGIDGGDMGSVRTGWGMIRRSSGRITRLVRNMLGYSSRGALNLEPSDLNALVDATVGDVHETAEMRGVELASRLDPSLPRVNIDTGALHDALLNLITNAIDAIPESRTDGRVTISTSQDSTRNRVILDVEDNGAGIPEEVRHRIYQLFFTTKGSAGTGIGLALTKKVIEEHGGRLIFDSRPGEGTIFRIELPSAHVIT